MSLENLMSSNVCVTSNCEDPLEANEPYIETNFPPFCGTGNFGAQNSDLVFSSDSQRPIHTIYGTHFTILYMKGL